MVETQLSRAFRLPKLRLPACRPLLFLAGRATACFDLEDEKCVAPLYAGRGWLRIFCDEAGKERSMNQPLEQSLLSEPGVRVEKVAETGEVQGFSLGDPIVPASQCLFFFPASCSQSPPPPLGPEIKLGPSGQAGPKQLSAPKFFERGVKHGQMAFFERCWVSTQNFEKIQTSRIWAFLPVFEVPAGWIH